MASETTAAASSAPSEASTADAAQRALAIEREADAANSWWARLRHGALGTTWATELAAQYRKAGDLYRQAQRFRDAGACYVKAIPYINGDRGAHARVAALCYALHTPTAADTPQWLDAAAALVKQQFIDGHYTLVGLVQVALECNPRLTAAVVGRLSRTERERVAAMLARNVSGFVSLDAWLRGVIACGGVAEPLVRVRRTVVGGFATERLWGPGQCTVGPAPPA